MELKIIANLINKKSFFEAKAGLLKLIENKIKFNDNFENIYFTLSQVCIQLNELKDSKKFLINHLETNPKDCQALLSLADLQLRTRDIENTEQIYKKILDIDKNYLPAIINLAIFYEGTGRINEAIKYYEIARVLEPKNLNFYYSLVRISPNYLNDKKIRFVKDLIKKKKIPIQDSFLAKLILSENYEKKKNYINEIKFLKMSQEEFLKHNVGKRSREYWLDIIPRYHNRFTYKKNSKSILKNINPIFIVGLPRSGSTITEMILSTSNTSKKVLGESGLLNFAFINNYGKKIFDNPKNSKIEIDINLLEEKILLGLNNFNISNLNKLIFIDKSLENFFYVEWIMKIFPKARFVVTERNIKDNIIGIYKKVLLDIPWAHSIPDIIEYINHYKKVISFYKRKYKDNFFFIKLEDMQNFNKTRVEDLFNFCGLKFNNEYFEFQQKKLFVDNASNIQIRNKSYKVKSNKYKNYYNIFENYQNKYPWIKF